MRGLTYWKLLAIKDLPYLSIKYTEIPSYQGCVRKGFSINTVALRCQCFPCRFRVFLSVSFLVFLQKVFFLFFSVFSSYSFYKKFPSYFFNKKLPSYFLQKFFFLFLLVFPSSFFWELSFYFFTKNFLPIFWQKVSNFN